MTGLPRLIAEALACLGAAECANGDASNGIQHLHEGLDIRRSIGSPRSLAYELSIYLNALLDAGMDDATQATARELMPLYDASPNHQRFPGYVALALVRAARARGDRVEEERLMQAGRRSVAYAISKLTDAQDRAAFSALAHNRELQPPIEIEAPAKTRAYP